MTVTSTPSPFEAVLFDLDGTLIDTAPDFVHAVNLQRSLYSLAPLSQFEIRKTVSDGARALIRLSFDIDEGDKQFEQKLDQLLEIYLENVAVHSALFEGINNLLIRLETYGIPWGIVTNKPRRFTTPLMEALNLSRRSAVTICPDDVKKTKPDPEPLHLACTRVASNPMRSLYVGDHIRDIQAGKNARMKTIAAAYGYIDHPEDALKWNADWTVYQPSELQDLIFLEHNN